MKFEFPNDFNLNDKMLVYGWFYKLGEPIISDRKYNELYKQLRNEYPDSEVIHKTWSELGEPTELLTRMNQIGYSRYLQKTNSESNLDRVFFMPQENMEVREKYYSKCKEHFEEYIPKSIDTIESIEQSKEWFDSIKGSGNTSVVINGSLKADGWFADAYYHKGVFVGGHTRGRADGDYRDVSKAMSHCLPLKISDTGVEYLKVSFEMVMMKSSLEILRKKDTTREWKNHRNSMSTLLLNTIPVEWYSFIVPYAHGCKGVEFDTATEMFEYLSDIGFTPIPNATLEVSSNENLISFIEYMSDMSLDIPSDGFVIQIDNRADYSLHESTSKYDDAIKAYRMFEWRGSLYISVVLGFSYKYNTESISVGLDLIPVTINNNRTVDRLDADNIARVIKSGVKPGSFVAFVTRSDSYVHWIDISSRYIEKCLEHGVNMEPDFVQAMQKFRRETETKLGLELNNSTYNFLQDTKLLSLEEN